LPVPPPHPANASTKPFVQQEKRRDAYNEEEQVMIPVRPRKQQAGEDASHDESSEGVATAIEFTKREGGQELASLLARIEGGLLLLALDSLVQRTCFSLPRLDMFRDMFVH
jgi:hypothetical protein